MKAKRETLRTLFSVRVDKGRYHGFDLRVTLPAVMTTSVSDTDDLGKTLAALTTTLGKFNIQRLKP